MYVCPSACVYISLYILYVVSEWVSFFIRVFVRRKKNQNVMRRTLCLFLPLSCSLYMALLQKSTHSFIHSVIYSFSIPTTSAYAQEFDNGRISRLFLQLEIYTVLKTHHRFQNGSLICWTFSPTPQSTRFVK